MRFEPTPLAGVTLATLEPFRDPRGLFVRTFCREELAQAGFAKPIAQVNHSRTERVGAVRGLHYQLPPRAETKLIRCLRGRVFDVAIDLRAGSPTFLRWFGAELSEENLRLMLVPEGCAHGFQVLEAGSELLYCHSEPYSPDLERAVRFDDPAVGIQWPLSVSEVSGRDQRHPLLSPDFPGLAIL